MRLLARRRYFVLFFIWCYRCTNNDRLFFFFSFFFVVVVVVVVVLRICKRREREREQTVWDHWHFICLASYSWKHSDKNTPCLFFPHSTAVYHRRICQCWIGKERKYVFVVNMAICEHEIANIGLIEPAQHWRGRAMVSWTWQSTFVFENKETWETKEAITHTPIHILDTLRAKSVSPCRRERQVQGALGTKCE